MIEGYQGVQFHLVTEDWPDGSEDLILSLFNCIFITSGSVDDKPSIETMKDN